MSDHSVETKTHHLLPRQGKPIQMIDSVTQAIIKALAYLPVYTAFVTTLTLLLIIFGIPFIGDR